MLDLHNWVVVLAEGLGWIVFAFLCQFLAGETVRRLAQQHAGSAQQPSGSAQQHSGSAQQPCRSSIADIPKSAAADAATVPISTTHGKRRFVRDLVYGFVEVSGLAKTFIDTPEFQELRSLRQLGLSSFVFPSATHTRFEHSIGVYHVVGLMLRSIASEQPELFPTAANQQMRLIELVKLAGLLHDLGHCAFSHTFDEQVAKALGLPEHEERGVQLLRQMVTRHHLAISAEEVDLICDLILGQTDFAQRPHIGAGAGWLADLVHNRDNELDADKIDYINRDSIMLGFGHPIQHDRIALHMRVLRIPSTNSQLRVCYHRKVFWQVSDVFTTRWRLFREVYRHKAVLAVEALVGDLMRRLHPILAHWVRKGVRPTDDLIAALPAWLPFIPDDIISPEDKHKARALFDRLRSRNLYRLQLIDLDQDQKSANVQDDGDDDDETMRVRVGFSALAEDPVTRIWFYDCDGNISHIQPEKHSKLYGSVPRVASETLMFRVHKS